MTLDPDQRTNFLDLLRPPSGYRLDAAAGTTYSMDFVALTAMLLAFVDAEAETETDKLNQAEVSAPPTVKAAAEAETGAGRLNQVEVLRAITRLARHVRVFVDRGHINGKEARRHGKLSSLFDRIVSEVAFDQGCFHPKVWVARYEPKASAQALGQKPIVRIVCASRNLTTSACWELFAAFEGQESGGIPESGKTGLISGLASFLARLNRETSGSEGVLGRLQKALQSAQIDLPDEMQKGCRFEWQWHGGPPLWASFPQRGTRALVVSPFLRATFLSRLVTAFERLTIVSTQEELDALSDPAHQALTEGNELFVVRSAEAEDGSAAMQLHAKLFICETPAATTVLLGSANASDSAWKSRNCEAVVTFSPGLSIDQFYKSFIFPAKPDPEQKDALRGWIERYVRQPVIQDDTVRIEKDLDQLQRLLSAQQFHAAYDATNQLLRVTCPNLAKQSDLLTLASQYPVRLCPLSRFERDSDLVPLKALLADGAVFKPFQILDLTDFLLLEIAHPSAQPRLFIVMARTDFAALHEERDAAILNEFLTPESFRLFLRAILFDGVSGGTPPPTSPGTNGRKGQGPSWTLLGDTTLEDVMQSCTEDPTRIGEINQLLDAFRKTKAADNEFEQFLEFWTLFQSAHAAAQGPPHA
jgi:hypothetical protein